MSDILGEEYRQGLVCREQLIPRVVNSAKLPAQTGLFTQCAVLSDSVLCLSQIP